MANTAFGGVQIVDGQAAATSLQPNSVRSWDLFIAGVQTTGTNKGRFVAGAAGTIVDVRAYMETAPTGAAFVIDVMKNGVTMFTTSANRPTIAISGKASTVTLPDILTFVAGDRIQVDIITVGSSVAGSDLAVAVTYKTPHLA